MTQSGLSAWHPKGRFLVIDSNDNVQLLDTQSAQIMKPVLLDHGARGVDWNSKGTLLITTSIDGRIQVWTNKATLLKTIRQYLHLANKEAPE